MKAHASMPNVLLTQPVHADVLARLRACADVDMNPGPEPWSADALRARLADADAMMAFMTDRVDAALLAAAPRLRFIACALKGYDNFDVEACARAGVQLSFVPDLLTEPTAELALGLAIAAGRHLLAGDAVVRGGGFRGWRPVLYGTGLHRACVAVVGLGMVGHAIVDRLQGFGCGEILGVDPRANDPRVRMVSLPAAVQRADYLFLAVPLTAATRGLIGDDMIAACRPGQIVVNVGRGSVVDEAAIARGLAEGRIGAYAADVFEMEDWRLDDRPASIAPALRESPRTVFTPHLGSAVAQVRHAIEHRAADSIVAALSGRQPQNLLTATA